MNLINDNTSDGANKIPPDSIDPLDPGHYALDQRRKELLENKNESDGAPVALPPGSARISDWLRNLLLAATCLGVLGSAVVLSYRRPRAGYRPVSVPEVATSQAVPEVATSQAVPEAATTSQGCAEPPPTVESLRDAVRTRVLEVMAAGADQATIAAGPVPASPPKSSRPFWVPEVHLTLIDSSPLERFIDEIASYVDPPGDQTPPGDPDSDPVSPSNSFASSSTQYHSGSGSDDGFSSLDRAVQTTMDQARCKIMVPGDGSHSRAMMPFRRVPRPCDNQPALPSLPSLSPTIIRASSITTYRNVSAEDVSAVSRLMRALVLEEIARRGPRPRTWRSALLSSVGKIFKIQVKLIWRP